MKEITKYTIYLLAIAIAGILSACTSEFDQPDLVYDGDDAETTEVDINLSFGADWTIDIDETRATPPGTGGNNDNDSKVNGDEDMKEVDKVRVIAFKRREETADPFIYDVRNDKILDVEKESIPPTDGKPSDHHHWVAHGKLQKTYGYEYRVIAVAYASQKTNLYNDINKASGCKFEMPNGEQNWFTINTDSDPTYEQVMARLNFETLPDNVKSDSWRDFIKYDGTSFGLGDALDTRVFDGNTGPLSYGVAQVPQLFYGILHSPSGSEIISYSETNASGELKTDLPLSGILYRGVAKLEIKLKLTKPTTDTILYPIDYYQWIALVADNVTTDVNLSSYDGFLSPVKNGLNEGYTAVNYIELGSKDIGGEKTLTTWFLPTRTKLALRIKSDRNHSQSIKNFQITTTDPIYSSGNGTGIMSPDVVDGVFYLRRNHQYTILEIDVDKLMNSSHELN